MCDGTSSEKADQPPRSDGAENVHLYLNSVSSNSYTYVVKKEDGGMDDLRFYVLFNSISVILGRGEVEYERVCAMEPRLRLRRFRLERGLNLGSPDHKEREEKANRI